MQKQFLLILFFFTFLQSQGQDSSGIFGRWRVVVMDNGVKHDYKTATYKVSQALRDSFEIWKEGLFNLQDYINWAASCPECYFEFKKDSVYQDFRETELRSQGTFTIIPRDKVIKVTIKTETQTGTLTYEYELKGPRLILRVPSFFMKEKLLIELERAD